MYVRLLDPASFTEDGYFRTGDLATRSEDGYYTLQGRKSDLIISGGFNIDPREIEEMLATGDDHPPLSAGRMTISAPSRTGASRPPM